MAGFSKTLAEAIAASTLTNTSAFTVPTTRYLSLHTAEPGDDSAVASEAAYTGYSRVNVTTAFALTTPETSAGEVTVVVHNTAAVEFGANAGVASTVVSHWAIWKVSSAGVASDLLFSGALLDGNGDPTTRTIQTGDIPTFQAGQLKIKLV